MTTETDTDIDDSPMDMKAVEADIANGARAYTKLLNHSADDWTSWSITIVGLRGLRNLAFANAQTTNVLSQAYRDAMSGLLGQRKYSVYDNITKQTRSACYKLADSVEEVSAWYASLAPADQLRWKHPEAIVKHCPKHLIAGGRGHNKPPRKPSAKKPITSFESLRPSRTGEKCPADRLCSVP
jgi:hypothetical protein